MNTRRNTFLLFLLSLIFTGLSAQEAEVVTEASEPEAEEEYVDGIVKKRLIANNRIMPWEPIREADIAWEKRVWRVIDTREKMNLPFRYPGKHFITLLKELAENEELIAFKDETFKEKMSIEELQGKFASMDTVMVFNEDTYEQQVKVVPNELNPDDITRYRVKEIWFFDEETSRLRVRILGISPIQEHFDEDTGVFKYEEPLFWVYYPAVREPFSKHEVFNDFNDAGPTTWYDLFESRFFTSYIYKVTNVYNNRVEDYFDKTNENFGVDMLLESQRLKEELFNFEHDLWSY